MFPKNYKFSVNQTKFNKCQSDLDHRFLHHYLGKICCGYDYILERNSVECEACCSVRFSREKKSNLCIWCDTVDFYVCTEKL